jgi:type II secretory pathway pseudopilin PulG
MKKTNKKQQSGRSMIEMVGVLAVMGLITAGAFVLISSASSSSKRNRAVDDIMEIAAGVRSVYAEHDDFSGGIDGKILTAINKSDKGPYSGSTYSVAANTDTTKFDVKLTNVPAKDCNGLKIRGFKDATTACSVAATATTGTGTVTVTFDK